MEDQQLVRQHAYVVGPLTEYVIYFGRPGVRYFSDFARAEGAKCVNGFTAVGEQPKPSDPPGLFPQGKLFACNLWKY